MMCFLTSLKAAWHQRMKAHAKTEPQPRVQVEPQPNGRVPHKYVSHSSIYQSSGHTYPPSAAGFPQLLLCYCHSAEFPGFIASGASLLLLQSGSLYLPGPDSADPRLPATHRRPLTDPYLLRLSIEPTRFLDFLPILPLIPPDTGGAFANSSQTSKIKSTKQ